VTISCSPPDCFCQLLLVHQGEELVDSLCSDVSEPLLHCTAVLEGQWTLMGLRSVWWHHNNPQKLTRGWEKQLWGAGWCCMVCIERQREEHFQILSHRLRSTPTRWETPFAEEGMMVRNYIAEEQKQPDGQRKVARWDPAGISTEFSKRKIGP
jgi:hypothetical protein